MPSSSSLQLQVPSHLQYYSASPSSGSFESSSAIVPLKRSHVDHKPRFFTFSSHDIRHKEPNDLLLDPQALKEEPESLTSSTEYYKISFNSVELQKRYEEEVALQKNSFFRKGSLRSGRVCEAFETLKVEPSLPLAYTPSPNRSCEYFTFSYADICKSLQKPQAPLKVGHWTTFPRSSIKLASQQEIIDRVENMKLQAQREEMEAEEQRRLAAERDALLQRALARPPAFLTSQVNEQTKPRQLDRAATAPLLATRQASVPAPQLSHSHSQTRVNSRAARLQAAVQRDFDPSQAQQKTKSQQMKENIKAPSVAFVDDRTSALVLQSNKLAKKPVKPAEDIRVPRPQPPQSQAASRTAPVTTALQQPAHRPVSHEFSRLEASLQVADRIPSFAAPVPLPPTHFLSYGLPQFPAAIPGRPSADDWVSYHNQQLSLWKLMQAKWTRASSNPLPQKSAMHFA